MTIRSNINTIDERLQQTGFELRGLNNTCGELARGYYTLNTTSSEALNKGPIELREQI